MLGGRPAPKDVYSAVVTNAINEAVMVHVTYKMPTEESGGVYKDSKGLKPGDEWVLDRKVVKSGTMDLTATIVSLIVETDGGSPVEVTAPMPGVSGPEANYPIHIVTDDSNSVQWAHRSRVEEEPTA